MSRLFGKFGKLLRNKDRNKENEEPFAKEDDFPESNRRRLSHGRPNRPTWHQCDEDYLEDRACYSNSVAHRRKFPKGPKSCPVDIEEERGGSPQDRSFGTEFEFNVPPTRMMSRGQERFSQRGEMRTMRNHEFLQRSPLGEEADQIQQLEGFVRNLQSTINKKDQKLHKYKEELKRVLVMKGEIEQALTQQLGRVRQERDLYREQCRSLEMRLENTRQYQNLPIAAPALRLGSGFRGMQPDNTPSTSALESITGAGESLTTQSNCSFFNEFMPPMPPPPPQQSSLFPTNPFATQPVPGINLVPSMSPLTLEEKGDEIKDFRSQRRSMSYSFHNDSRIEEQRSGIQSRLNSSGRANSEIILLEDSNSTTTLQPDAITETPRRRSASYDFIRSLPR